MALRMSLPKKIRRILCRLFDHQRHLLSDEKRAMFWCPYCGMVGYYSMFESAGIQWREPDESEQKFIERFERQDKR